MMRPPANAPEQSSGGAPAFALSSPVPPAAVSVNIDRLIVEGTSAAFNGNALGLQVEAALHHLLGSPDFAPTLSSVTRREIAIPTITLSPNASETQIARAVADALHRALRRGG